MLKHLEAPHTNGRRHFVVRAMGAIVAAMGAALGIPAVGYLFWPAKTSKHSNWVEAGDISKLSPGVPHELIFVRTKVDGWRRRMEQDTAWIVKAEDGSVIAFSPRCTHLGCAYHWDTGKAEFVCPCHGSWFSKTGKVLAGPAPRPLDRYEARLENNRLWLGSVIESKRSGS